MAIIILANGNSIRNQVKEYSPSQMDHSMKVNGVQVKLKVKEP